MLRDASTRTAGVILAHHTKKLSKQQVKDDPFLALSGASALRGFYTSGLILHRPDEDSTERRLEIELRNGPALPAEADRQGERPMGRAEPDERAAGAPGGRRQARCRAAAQARRHPAACCSMRRPARRLYTADASSPRPSRTRGGLGSKHTIRERLGVLATKGFVKFLRDAAASGSASPPTGRSSAISASRAWQLRTAREEVDPDTGEITAAVRPVLPSHFKCPQSGRCLPGRKPRGLGLSEEAA